MFDLLVKVATISRATVDQGLIPGNSLLRQKSGVGQEIEIFWVFKTWLLIQLKILKLTDKKAS